MRTKLALFAGMAALLLHAPSASAQVSVTATAGDPGPTPYTTLGAAFTAINAGIPQGDITIDIQASTSEGANAAVLNSSGAGTAVYTSVLIRPTSDGVTISGASLSGRGIIELNGADSVTINGDNPNTPGTNRDLTIQNTAVNTTTYTSVVRVALSTLITTGNSNTVMNTVILGSATGRNIATATSTVGSEFTTYGILMGGGASTVSATTPPSAITSVSTLVPTGQTATNFIVNNNRIDACARGIAVQGSAVTVAPGLTVTNNVIGSATAGNATTVYARGMTLQGFDTTTIAGNTIQNMEYFVSTQQAGIFLGDVSATGQNAVVERNNITNVFNQAAGTFGAYGINAAAGNAITVRNNFVSNINHVMTGGAAFSTTFGVFGIRLGTGINHKVYHNSVNLFGVMPGTPNTSLLSAAFAIVATTQTGIDVRNNAFANTLTGGTTSIAHVAVYLPTSGTGTMNLTLNNNGYYTGTTAGASGLAHVGTTYTAVPVGSPTFAGLYTVANFNVGANTPNANFRAYTSILSAAGTNDNASFATTSAAPYTSSSNLHIPNGTTTRLESGGVGTAITGVTTDIDGDPRPNGAAPDIGADEFAGVMLPANDVAASSIVAPATGSVVVNGGSVTPQAQFENAGLAAQAGVSVQFTITGPGGYSYADTQSIATMSPGQFVTVTFAAAPAFTTIGFYNTAATVMTPDGNPSNDQVTGSFEVRNPVSGGSYSVPGNYPSLTNVGGIFAELNAVGATGNIVLNIAADLTAETGTFALNQLAGGFTVTIKPIGAPRTISGTSVGSTGLIKLNAADGVTIDGSLSGGTDRSLTITNANATGAVVWIASLTGNGATGNAVKNCVLSGGPGVTAVAGVMAGSGTTFGGLAEAPNSNNTIQNNSIFRVQNSAFLSGAAALDQNWLITGNTFGSTVAADKNIFRGMFLANAQSFVISNNTINGVVSTATSTSNMSGIQLSTALNGGSVFGNKISDIKQTNTTGYGAHGINIAGSAASNLSVFNNFIWDVAGQGFNGVGVSDNGWGIIVTAGGGVSIRYNSVLMGTNQVAATSISAAINITSGVTAAGAIDLRDNIFANTETVGTRYAIYDASTAAIFSTINFNDYFSSQNVGFLTSARVTLADWQAATGQDASSRAVDPVFVSGTNLHLQPTSTLVSAGTPIAGITTDIDNDPRHPTAPDIGADEQPKADLSATKADSPDPVTAGANLTYTLTVANAGPASAATASLSDPLPAGTTFVALASAAGWSCTTPPVGSGGTVSCTNPVMGLGNAIFTLTVNVAPSVAAGTVLTNTATASAATLDPNPGNESGTATTTVAAAADLAVTKADSPDPVTAGANLTYTITAANAGPSNAATASLSDPLPTGTTFVSLASAAGWSCTTPPVGSGGTVTCTNPSMAVGNAIFTLTVNVAPSVPAGTVLSNTATASAATPDPNPGNESGTATTTVATSADLAVTKTDTPDPVVVGNNLTYTVTVANAGPSNAATASLSDPLPAGTTFVSLASAAGWSCTTPPVGSGGTVSCTNPSLVTGNAVFTLVVNVGVGVPPGTVLTNTATAASATPDPNPGNESGTATTTVSGLANIAVTMTVNNSSPGVGTNVTFTITVNNIGSSPATSVQVTDLLPPGLTYVSSVPSVGTYTPATGVWNIGPLTGARSVAGTPATLSLVATVTRPEALVNQATKTAQGESDSNASDNAALLVLNGPPLADIQVQQTASNLTPPVGTNVTFTITAKNAGPANSTGVAVTDLLPASLTFVSATPSQGTYVPGTGVWTVGSITSGASATLQIVATVTSMVPVSNIATKTAETQADYAAVNDAASVTLNSATPADMAVGKTPSQEPAVAGTTFRYTIVVANYGPASGTGVIVTDPLPAGVTFVSATPSQGTCTGTSTVSCPLGTVRRGGGAQIAIVVNKTAGGQVSNAASVAANEGDPNNANNSSTVLTTPTELLTFEVE